MEHSPPELKDLDSKPKANTFPECWIFVDKFLIFLATVDSSIQEQTENDSKRIVHNFAY